MDERKPDTGQDLNAAWRSLTAREAAAVLGVNERAVRRAISHGELVASKRGGVFQILPGDLASYRETRSGPGRASMDPPNGVPPAYRELTLAGRLPTPTTALIGRERELDAVLDLLRPPEGHRLVVLTGPGGVGKTLLAVAVAVTAASVFADGVAYVPLAPIRDPALVAAAIARAVGARETGDNPLAELIAARVADQQRLVVLDNFEQLVEAGPLLGELLASCPCLTLLVTSRARLRLSGEHDFPVPPLSLPNPEVVSNREGEPPDAVRLRSTANSPGGTRQTGSQVGKRGPRDIEQSAAVQLFVARARAVNPGFELTDRSASAVAEICRRLDGIPLAIELAAARSTVLSPVALLARFDRLLPFLTDGPRDAPRRQRTLRDAVAWSYDLLDPAEQTLFRQLAVFAGGFTAEAAEGVLCEAFPPPVFDGLASLVDKNLLQVAVNTGGEPRFAMLETIREYGLEQLQAYGEWERTRRLHVEYFLAFAEAVEPKLRGRDQGAQLELLETEHDNLRAALTWILEAADRAEHGLRLAGALHWFWYLRGHFSEGRRWLKTVLTQPAAAERTPARVKALVGAAMLASRQDDYSDARRWLQESIAIARELGDLTSLTHALHFLAMGRLLHADHAALQALVSESVALYRETGDCWGLATSLHALGMAAVVTLRFDDARAPFAESLALYRELQDTWGLARVLHYSGEIARARGDYGDAQALYEESLALYHDLGHRFSAATVTHNLGYVAEHLGSPERALALFAQALRDHVEYGDRTNIAHCLAGVASMLGRLGQPGPAARLFGAAAGLLERVGIVVWPIDKVDYDRHLASIRGQLTPTAFVAVYEAGRAMLLEEALAEAFARIDASKGASADASASSTPVPGECDSCGLTPRELDVLRLLAHRATNREIADALSISSRTVMHHVSRILAKIGVKNRRDAAAWATQHSIA